jgi:hypothetical protein
MKLSQLLKRTLHEDASSSVRDARRRTIKTTAQTGREGGAESEVGGKWRFTSQQGIKITELGNNSYEVEFEGKSEKGDFESTIKRIKAASKLEYSRREAKVN